MCACGFIVNFTKQQLACRLCTESWPVCSSLTHLVVGNAAAHCDALLRKCPRVAVADLDGSTMLTGGATTLPHSLAALAESCPVLTEVRCWLAQDTLCMVCWTSCTLVLHISGYRTLVAALWRRDHSAVVAQYCSLCCARASLTPSIYGNLGNNPTMLVALQVHIQVDKSETMDECLAALRSLLHLHVLSVTVASFVLDERQMAALGDLPLADLRLISQVSAAPWPVVQAAAGLLQQGIRAACMLRARCLCQCHS